MRTDCAKGAKSSILSYFPFGRTKKGDYDGSQAEGGGKDGKRCGKDGEDFARCRTIRTESESHSVLRGNRGQRAGVGRIHGFHEPARLAGFL